MDITTGGKLSSILVANMKIVYWSFLYQAGGVMVKRGWMGRGIVILARCKFHFIRVHENLVKDPTNNKSIIVSFHFKSEAFL